MKRKYKFIIYNSKFIILLLLLCSARGWAASCPTDSVITFDQNGVPTEKTLYAYDDAGRQTLTETQRLTNGVITFGSKTQTTYYATGKTQMTAKWTWSTTANDWVGSEKNEYTYDTKGNTLTWEIYNWGTDDWAKKTKYEYAYEGKNQTLSVYYKGSGTEWLPQTKHEYAYQGSNKILDRYWSGYDAQTQTWIGSSWQAWEYNSTTSPKSPTMTEQYTWENGAWKGTSKYDYEYDTYGNQTLSRFYNTYDAATQMWSPSSENHYAYFNGDKNMRTLLEQYTWKEGAKTGVTKEEYAYDAGGNLTMTTIYQWDTATKTFIPISKLQIEYDEWENEIYHEEYAIQNGKWVGIKKEEHTYTDKTYLTLALIYHWDATLGDWVYVTRDTAAYDANKNQILDERYTWAADVSLPEGGYWKGTKKEVSEYTNNKQTLREIYLWVEDTRDWTYQSKVIYAYSGNRITLDEEYALVDGVFVGTKKERYAYNANGQTTLIEQYTWQNNTWVGTTRKEYAFNTAGQQTMHAYYTWKNNAWVGTEKKEQELDGEGRVIVAASYQWKNNAWVGTTRYDYVYQDDGKVYQQVSWQWKNNDWAKEILEQYTYTGSGDKSEILYASWTGTEWTLTQWWRVRFDETGRAVADSTARLEGENWYLTNRNTNTYDSEDRLTLTMTENWQHGVQTSGNKTTYTYNSFGQTNTTKYVWGTNDWEFVSKTDNTYNEEGNLTQSSSYDYAGNDWVETQRTTNTYINGKQTLAMTQMWKNGVQVSGSKQEYEYNDTETIITSFTWQDAAWVGTTRIGYTYYSGNKVHTETNYYWNGVSWEKDTKKEYEYSGTKNKVTAEYSWVNGAWEGKSKTGSFYDEGETLTSATWTWNGTGWTPKTKSGKSTYADGRTMSETTYKVSGADFVYNTRTEYAYGTGAKDMTTTRYTWKNGAWEGVSKEGVTYLGGKLATDTVFLWVSGWDWTYSTLVEYEYGEGKDQTTAHYVWNNAWVGVDKTSQTYTDKGDPWTKYVYCWRDGTWADSLKQEHNYDERGNDTLFIDAQWKNGVWSNLATSTKWELRYDEKDNVVLDAHYVWKPNKNAWAGTGKKYEYAYDAANHKVLEYTYTWSSNKWSASLQKEWNYDQWGNLILDVYKSYNSSRNKWNGTKSEYAYNDKGTQIMSASYSWDTDHNDWSGLSRTETAYSPNGELLATYNFQWSSSLWTWIGMFKYEYVYDAAGRAIEQTVSRYNTTTSEWYYDTHTISAYDQKGRTIQNDRYLWATDQWYLRSTEQTIYDDNSDDKLREQLSATYSEIGEPQAYSEKTYYYSCDPKYTLTAVAKDDLGTVSGSGTYTYYAHVPVSAEGDSVCSTFNRWTTTSPITTFPITTSSPTGGGLERASLTIVVTSDMTLTAEFTPTDHTLTAGTTDLLHGSVTISVEQCVSPFPLVESRD